MLIERKADLDIENEDDMAPVDYGMNSNRS